MAKQGLRPPVQDLWGASGTKFLNDVPLDPGAVRPPGEVAGYRAVQALDEVGPTLPGSVGRSIVQ